jgi:hypothetical protein
VTSDVFALFRHRVRAKAVGAYARGDRAEETRLLEALFQLDLMETKVKKPESDCVAMMASRAMEGHVHTCSGKHSTFEDHFCPECHRWWGTRR